MKDLSLLEKKLKVEFSDKSLLRNAFAHRSYLNENKDFDGEHNERLEFLGDAVLELVVTEYLYKTYPQEPEGELTTWRAALVKASMLSLLARELEFNDYLMLSKVEEKETGRARDYILANSFESFVGALYLDQGFKVCEKFIARHLLSKLPHILETKEFEDAKSRFQEMAQEKESVTPNYKTLEEWGPDHAKHFKIGVFLNTQLVAEGEGSSKQEAEEAAARNALKIKQW
jgi:ribonuclease-3